jgi:hypothetical protein
MPARRIAIMGGVTLGVPPRTAAMRRPAPAGCGARRPRPATPDGPRAPRMLTPATPRAWVGLAARVCCAALAAGAPSRFPVARDRTAAIADPHRTGRSREQVRSARCRRRSTVPSTTACVWTRVSVHAPCRATIATAHTPNSLTMHRHSAMMVLRSSSSTSLSTANMPTYASLFS